MTLRPFLALVLVLTMASCAPYMATSTGRLKVQGLSFNVPRAWNKWAENKLSDTVEIWTNEGLALDFIGFAGGLSDGQTIFKESPTAQVPRFRRDFDIVQVAELFEYSLGTLSGNTAVDVGGLQPITFAGRPGFRFTYNFTAEDELVRNGIASGAVVDGKLYMIFFHGSRVYHFDKYRAEVERMMASASIAS